MNLGFAVKVFQDGERQCSDDRTEEQQQQTCPVASFAGRGRNLGKCRLACASGPAAPPGGSSCPSESACCGRKLRDARHIRRRQPLGVFASAGWAGILCLGFWSTPCIAGENCSLWRLASLNCPTVNFSTTHCEGHVTTEAAGLANRKGRNNASRDSESSNSRKFRFTATFLLRWNPKSF